VLSQADPHFKCYLTSISIRYIWKMQCEWNQGKWYCSTQTWQFTEDEFILCACYSTLQIQLFVLVTQLTNSWNLLIIFLLL